MPIKPQFERLDVCGYVRHPKDQASTGALWRNAEAEYGLADQDAPTTWRSCPQGWARGVHLRAMADDLGITMNMLGSAAGIAPEALNAYLLPDDSPHYRQPTAAALRAVEAAWLRKRHG